MALLPITGIPSSYRYPAAFAQINFGQGPSTAAGGRRTICLVMPMLAAGATWTANGFYEIRKEQDAAAGAGEGSPLHRAARAVLACNKTTKLYAVPYMPSSGGAPATATIDVTFATTATATGVAEVWVCGELCSAAYHTGDTPTVIAALIRDSINAKSWLPVLATASVGAVSIAAKIAGASQGTATYGQFQVRARTTPGTGTTVSPAAGEVGSTVAGADGTTTEAANLLAALNTLVAVRHYYLGVSMHDSVGLGHVKSHVAVKSEPNPGLRSVAVAAYPHTLAAGQTLATALNYERIRIGWQNDGDDDVATIVGNLLGAFQLEEERDSAAGFDLYRVAGRWNVKPAYDRADWPDMDDCNDAINDGLTPIASDAAGSFIVMSVTTRSKNSGGTQDDFRAAESHRVSVCDEYVDRLLARDAATFVNKKLQSDVLLSDGTVDTGRALPPNTTTPENYKRWLFNEIDTFAPGKFQEVAAMRESVRCVRDPSNTGRLEVAHQIRTVDIRHQVTFDLAETSPG